MAIEVEVKKWGNSKAVILPSEYAKTVGIGEKLLIEPVKKIDLKKVFGILPRTTSGQKFKDEIREGSM